MDNMPLVSAVIPTRNRPNLVCRAVRSALGQTHTNLEVVVVVDGHDPLTLQTLEALNEPRLRIIALDEGVGGSEARNIGVREAKGEWIAFLDDDDEWLPSKTEKQLAAALEIKGPSTFIACQFVDRDKFGDRIAPTTIKRQSESFSDYLFCRHGLTGGTGYVQTSTWLVSRPLADKIQFTYGLKRNQDIDWMIRAMSLPNAHFELLMEPLSVFNSLQDKGRVSKTSDWEFQYCWAMSNRQYLSREALAYFLSTICVEDAVRQGKRLLAIPTLLKSIINCGGVSMKCFCFFLYYLLVSERTRHKLRIMAFMLKKRRLGLTLF